MTSKQTSELNVVLGIPPSLGTPITEPDMRRCDDIWRTRQGTSSSVGHLRGMLIQRPLCRADCDQSIEGEQDP